MDEETGTELVFRFVRELSDKEDINKEFKKEFFLLVN
jgi:hypothetical protein